MYRKPVNGWLGRGCQICCLAASLVFGLLAQAQAEPEPEVWGCLLYASNDKTQGELPASLSRYYERLHESLGYSAFRVVAQGETVLKPGQENWLKVGTDIRVLLYSVSRTGRGEYTMTLQVFDSGKPLIETQARVNRGSPLFIRGPAWHAGQLVLAVMVES
jgi:hypothetical protein